MDNELFPNLSHADTVARTVQNYRCIYCFQRYAVVDQAFTGQQCACPVGPASSILSVNYRPSHSSLEPPCNRSSQHVYGSSLSIREYASPIEETIMLLAFTPPHLHFAVSCVQFANSPQVWKPLVTFTLFQISASVGFLSLLGFGVVQV